MDSTTDLLFVFLHPSMEMLRMRPCARIASREAEQNSTQGKDAPFAGEAL